MYYIYYRLAVLLPSLICCWLTTLFSVILLSSQPPTNMALVAILTLLIGVWGLATNIVILLRGSGDALE